MTSKTACLISTRKVVHFRENPHSCTFLLVYFFAAAPKWREEGCLINNKTEHNKSLFRDVVAGSVYRHDFKFTYKIRTHMHVYFVFPVFVRRVKKLKTVEDRIQLSQ